MVLEGRESSRRAGEYRHVNIVSAGLHNSDSLASQVGGAGLARVGETSFFSDGKAVEIGTYQQGRSRAIFEHADNSVAAKLFGNLETCLAKLGRDFGRSFFLHQRELRVRV